MPDEFDPLYHWLGIPPDEQPANHYRLLGLALYEEHPDVIAMAADRQMSHVRTFQAGKRQQQAEELLNQLAAAQICLLNPNRREEYNAQLRMKLAARANAPVPVMPTPSIPPIPPPANSAAQHLPQSAPLLESLWASISLKSPIFWQLPLAGLAFVLVLLVGWQVVKSVRVARREALLAARAAQTSPVKQPPVAVVPKKPEPANPPAEAAPPVTPTPPTIAEPVAPPEPKPAPPTPTPEPASPAPVPVPTPAADKPLPTEDPPAFMPLEPAPVPLTPQRRALPTGETLDAARASVAEVYAKELALAVSPTQRKALAEKMLQDARKLTDDPVGQFAMLQQARTLAIETAQPKLLLDVVNELIATFDYDPLPTRGDALHAIAGQLKQPSALTLFAEQCAALVDDALAQEKVDLAREMLQLGIAAATKASDRETVKELTARRDELARVEQLQQELAAVQATLASNPGDPDANLYLGKYLCLVKNDWGAGLANLTKGADFALAAIAVADLKQPTDASERATLGDQWWNFASTDAPQAAAFRHRALHWYKLAEPELKGLTQARIAQRLTDTWTGPSGGPEPAISPLNAAQARERQVKWAQWLKVPVTKSNKLDMRFMLIPPGQFRMGGSAAGSANTPQIETPAHVVRITRPFYISTHEVSVAQYAEFVKTTKHVSELDQARDRMDFDPFPGRGRSRTRTRQPAWLSPSYVQLADHPAVNISWDDAQAFCRWLSQVDGVQYSLPTEAQWEYACRAGTETLFSFGDGDNRLDGYAVHAGNSPKSPQRIGQKRPNAWGLRDMHGNVAEWCADWFSTYESTLAEDPIGPELGTSRVVRGGHWGERTLPRSALRAELAPDAADEHIGFRVICSAGAVSK